MDEITKAFSKWNFSKPVINESDDVEFKLTEYEEKNISAGKDPYRTSYTLLCDDLISWVHPQSSFLQVTYKIRTANKLWYGSTAQVNDTEDTVSGAGGAVATRFVPPVIINHVGSIFTDIEFSFNNDPVEPQIKNNHIGLYVDTMLRYSEDYAKTVASSWGYAIDTTAHNNRFPFIVKGSTRGNTAGDRVFITGPGVNMAAQHAQDLSANTEPLGTNNGYLFIDVNVKYNDGYKKRRVWADTAGAANGVYTVFIPLAELSPFCRGVNQCFKGVNLKLRMNKNADTIYLTRQPAILDGILGIEKLSWWMPSYTPSKMQDNEVTKLIENGSKSSLLWQGRQIYDVNVGSSSIRWDISSEHTRITSVIIIIQHSSQETSQIMNAGIPYHAYDNIAANDATTVVNTNQAAFKSAQLRVGSNYYPRKQYNLDYAKKDVLENWFTFLKISNKMTDVDSGLCNITYDDFCTTHKMLCFDLEEMEDNVFDNGQQIQLIGELDTRVGFVYQNLKLYAVVFSERRGTVELENQTSKFYQK